MFESIDPLRTISRQCKFACHCVHSISQPLDFVTCGKANAVVKLAGSDIGDTVLNSPNWLGHVSCKQPSEQGCKQGATQYEAARSPKRLANWLEGFR